MLKLFASSHTDTLRNRLLVNTLAACFSLGAIAFTADAASPQCVGPNVHVTPLCGRPLAPPQISCAVPTDTQISLSAFPRYSVQRATNIFSWQAFVGLHWPASKTERGVPDAAVKLGAPGPTVWETWRETSEIFRTDTAGNPIPPLAWNAPSTFPAQCGNSGVAVDRVLYRTSKVDDLLSDIEQPTGATITRPITLKNQRGELTRYEVRMNRTAYDAISAPENQWWDGRRQASVNTVRFPSGSMIVKAAWTPVNASEAARFHTVNACVCDAAPTDANPTCAVKAMGLTGFHLMSKTNSAPQWLWSTFEQQDNVPAGSCPVPPAPVSGVLKPTAAAAAVAPSTYWNPAQGLNNANQQTLGNTPSQICREIPIPNQNPACANPNDATDNVASLNLAMQSGLRDTRYANYQLVNTQWPVPGTQPANAPHTAFSVLPALLGNTTLESFIQGTSSCMGCHAMARTRRHASLDPNDRGFVSSDFTFTLGLAQPKLTPSPKLASLAASCTPSSTDPKCVGLRVATNTYVELPSNVGAKLHCTSCHLDAGRNPRASWWQGMTAKYSTPPMLAKGGIAGRINQCFTNSLNGKKLCTPDAKGHCKDNTAMSGLIAYMDWLTDPANNPHHIPKPAAAFPDVGSGQGVAARGGQIYVQKCAFCHGKNGEGRYQDNTYYRPALWGNQSFNSSAGMNSASDLAPFIYGNMPLHSGGEISTQEAFDLACYIDSQPRPKGTLTKNEVSATGKITCAPSTPQRTKMARSTGSGN
ncbi:MAG TPA: c-type cytochrome [Casimicrobium sp.]|nr:c-type cytochrome [Casimicrobium sp.]